jgi:hypothetical protein
MFSRIILPYALVFIGISLIVEAPVLDAVVAAALIMLGVHLAIGDIDE